MENDPGDPERFASENRVKFDPKGRIITIWFLTVSWERAGRLPANLLVSNDVLNDGKSAGLTSPQKCKDWKCFGSLFFCRKHLHFFTNSITKRARKNRLPEVNQMYGHHRRIQ